ncbi:MAG TPA: polysaccharide deacetylase family protein [Gammaproteobacteria bacterium]|jgi:peptidoglycan/xylan/chitin deacetylase (PgdA/CDA1 family)|nr:polysaccharide deacetylase family protein [Gammaproteobacteria bacterium]
MSIKTIAIKIDVDTDRGTRIGVPQLLKLFAELAIPATFLFSLGPDNTGRAIKRIFRPGFLKKVSRSSIVSIYGVRTLLNGVLLPGPHIGKRNQAVMRAVQQAGHEVGIHCYDHIRWQDGLAKMTQPEVFAEFAKARNAFQNIFGFSAKTAGAAGWQANAHSLAAYDDAQLLYGSDTRGVRPFFPRVGDRVFNTLQIPTNLPTLDELIGRPEYPLAQLTDFYLSRLREDTPNIFTTHAEIEGMKYLAWFKAFLQKAQANQVKFIKVEEIAQQFLADRTQVPICDLAQGEIDGRSGTLALQLLTK